MGLHLTPEDYRDRINKLSRKQEVLESKLAKNSSEFLPGAKFAEQSQTVLCL
jgi:hypothetical protein